MLLPCRLSGIIARYRFCINQLYATKKAAEAAFQRVEKGVHLEESAVLHAEETARNRAEFRFLASGCRTMVLPPSKKRKA